MKKITDEFKIKKIKNMDKYLREDGYPLKIGDKEVRIPKRIIESLEKKMNLYEIENVKDLKENYHILSKVSFPPMDFMLWVVGETLNGNLDGFSLIEKADPKELDLLFELSHSASSRRELGVNYNQSVMDNVYLSNFNFIKNKLFEACEFDIRDRHEDLVRGVSVYKGGPLLGLEDLSEKIKIALSASEAEPFDITFLALSERYLVEKNGILVPRGKKIFVADIRRSKGKSENIEDVPSDDYILPIFDFDPDTLGKEKVYVRKR